MNFQVGDRVRRRKMGFIGEVVKVYKHRDEELRCDVIWDSFPFETFNCYKDDELDLVVSIDFLNKVKDRIK